MAVYTGALEIYRGEKKTWQMTVTGSDSAAQSLTSASILFTVASAIPAGSISGDSTATFARSTDSGCGITITDASAGVFQLQVKKSNTSALDVGTVKDYSYGLEILTSGETEPRVLAVGIFRILPDIVRAA